ncbi:MAG: cation efflux system protein [Dehalococcoidia bacterium]|nr:MAG: cation efflux system protein [Dehalococcoidia bacterium]
MDLDQVLHCHSPQEQEGSGRQEQHSHSHHEAGPRRLALVLGITLAFFVLQVVGGLWTGSLALLADSAHLLSDAAAVGLALAAAWLARRPPTLARTFGFRRAEVLAALINAVTLVVIALGIGREAYERLQEPHPIAVGPMLLIALAGLGANLLSLRILSAGRGLNERGAYLHVLGDLLGSLGVVLAGGLIALFGWYAADPILSLVIGGLVLVSATRLLREATNVLLLAAPADLDVARLARAIQEVPGVLAVHDLHVWTVTSGFVTLSAHLVVASEAEPCRVIETVTRLVQERFGISHVTLQVEHLTAQGVIHAACDPCQEPVARPIR